MGELRKEVNRLERCLSERDGRVGQLEQEVQDDDIYMSYTNKHYIMYVCS